jgi:uncharacterized lipoprotein YmbA
MSTRLVVLSLLCVSLVPAIAAQVPQSKATPSKADQSQEAFVIEQFSRKQRFENDGTSTREDTARVRIQSEAVWAIHNEPIIQQALAVCQVLTFWVRRINS